MSRRTRRGLLIYAFYDDALLERSHQQFMPYKVSKYDHARTGMQKDARTAGTLGTLDMGRVHCTCSHCKAPICGCQNCLVKGIVGAPTKKKQESLWYCPRDDA